MLVGLGRGDRVARAARVVLFAVVFVWTPPHFWALAMRVRDDYAAAGIPMMPVVRGEDETRRQIFLYSLVLFAVDAVLVPVASMGPDLPRHRGGRSAAVRVTARSAVAEPSRRRAPGASSSTRVYLAALFVAVALDALVWSAHA